VLVIFLVIAFGLARGRLPEAHPGRSEFVYWGFGLGTAAVFFASLLAHELSHAVVARRNGVEVDGITLWLLGGVARLRGEAATPGAELRIAGSGPLTSLVLGVFFAGAAALLGGLAAPGLLVEAVAWLAAINVLLALFNAIPAAPLDGGRLLRAFLWWRTGDRLRAALGATAAGRVLGWVLVLLGLALVVGGAGFNGIWLALIGWFVLAAAMVEGQQAQLRSVLAGIPVRQAMTPDPVTVPATATLAELSEEVNRAPIRQRHTAFPVAERDGEPVGLVAWKRVEQTPAEDRATMLVKDVMSPLAEAATAAPEEPLADLLPRLESSAERRALVLDDGRLAGIVSMSDVTRTVSWLASGPVPTPRRRVR
jgi:Zn-dependent protease/CBS domain-containing protein